MDEQLQDLVERIRAEDDASFGDLLAMMQERWTEKPPQTPSSA